MTDYKLENKIRKEKRKKISRSRMYSWTLEQKISSSANEAKTRSIPDKTSIWQEEAIVNL